MYVLSNTAGKNDKNGNPGAGRMSTSMNRAASATTKRKMAKM
jgi:hypothetical protein